MLLSIFQRLILISIMIVVILNLNEVFANLISANITPDFISYTPTPIYIKLLKDVLLLLLAMTAFSIHLKRKSSILILLLPLVFFVIIECSLTFIKNDELYAIAGLRWVLPFFLPILFINIISTDFCKKITNYIIIVFLISFNFQIYELFSNYNIYGFNSFHIPSRLPGLFYIPNTAGSFNCIAFCFIYFQHDNKKLRLILLPLILLSTFLINSGTAIVTLLIVVISIAVARWRDSYNNLRFQIYKLCIPIFLFFALFFLPEITNRATITSQSGFSRISYLIALLNKSELISTHFGKFTNTLAMIEIYYHKNLGYIIMDSTIGTILGNLGALVFVASILFFIAWFVLVILSINLEFFCFSICTIFFSMTTSLSESYPVNLLTAVAFSYLIPNIYYEFKSRMLFLKNTSQQVNHL